MAVPKIAVKSPAVLFIGRSGPVDRDGMVVTDSLETSPIYDIVKEPMYQDLARYLFYHCIASLRYEKR